MRVRLAHEGFPATEIISFLAITVYRIQPGDRQTDRQRRLSNRVPFYPLACFRRVLAGQRALRSHVRKVVGCERLEDCRRECAEEKRFHCESFNYR
ncbi:unnamed protein product [Chrysodeixis includens]|uniref:Apple domain-containing protein n=1 Tax=Chrysodeixis includens TaxID=689277 RepID=A0A9N8Q2H2_CHRIL|nr:unnamed protein product [Chrysodeixis includens]